MAYAFHDTVGILSNIIKTGRQIQVLCSTCRQFHRFAIPEIEALATKVGPDFNLLNRRCRCRLTPGCQGWNRFEFCSGVYRPMWDEATALRWSNEDRERIRLE